MTTASTYDADLGVGIVGRPLQRPRPEIVGTVVAPFSKGVVAMGARDFHPLSANFLLPQWVATHWPNYVQGKESVGAAASIGDWRVARTVFVAEDDAVAQRYARTDARSPYRFYYDKMLDQDARARQARAVQGRQGAAGRGRHARRRASTTW